MENCIFCPPLRLELLRTQKWSPYKDENTLYKGIFTVFVPKILMMVSEFGFNPLEPLFGY